ncbi:conserved hypothetical protein [Leishmania major strain Friedlin]|uniref:Thioredoxin domain-containing protein n=1 Tax=Leishmania major TaxID=5664 RepID=Q4QIV7_LEIMA|nr:conserved hypothetical protein [Leishmania major strain Friedlin]CAG9568917.1 Thioredoxin_-_putative [Leishmania major strain Friedlin]CAJ02166.1 conserved hypothetical protein [Leishmania major strain Friedlin]|eukprot:XP_001680891.1 conserved hypothetical protein [Leishmania major strain Friedlin]
MYTARPKSVTSCHFTTTGTGERLHICVSSTRRASTSVPRMRRTYHTKTTAVPLLAVALLLLLLLLGGTAHSAAAAEASRVVELTRDTFDAYVGGPDSYTFVLYCVTWSRQCKTVTQLWDRLSITQSQKELRDVFTAAYVDGDKYPDLVKRMNVKGFPTMLFYTPLHREGLEYNGPRESYLLDSFVFQFS